MLGVYFIHSTFPHSWDEETFIEVTGAVNMNNPTTIFDVVDIGGVNKKLNKTT